METVSFVNMADGTKEEYELLERLEEKYNETLPHRLLEALEGLVALSRAMSTRSGPLPPTEVEMGIFRASMECARAAIAKARGTDA